MSRSAVFAALVLAAAAAAEQAAAPADLVYRNGFVYTVDGKDSVQQALAVRAGRIVYVGTDAGARAFTGKATRVIDLHGRMLMPGLVDAHMHPQSGGSRLLDCSLDYRRLSVPQFLARIQACLDRDKNQGPDRWLVVVNWFQQGMQPEGEVATAATLDALQTARPIIVRSSFGHSVLLNSRALALAGIGATPRIRPPAKSCATPTGRPAGCWKTRPRTWPCACCRPWARRGISRLPPRRWPRCAGRASPASSTPGPTPRR